MLTRALVTGLLWAGVVPPSPSAHPLHTALAEIEWVSDRGLALIRVRVFADDLAAAVCSSPQSLPPDSALSRYVRGTLALSDSAGRPLQLQWERAERNGDMVVLQLEAKLAGGLHHARVLHAMLWEQFPDQVNIVRASYEGRTVTLLFTRGEAAKTLR